MRNVICISWGSKYGAPYVNRLYAMVRRNMTGPFAFTAFIEDPDGLRAEIIAQPLPSLPAGMPTGVPGIWRKSSLWGPTLGDLSGPVLFLDLDVVVTGPLDPFFDHGDPQDVILARNPAKPHLKLGQTSLYRFPVGALAKMQALFARDPQGIGERYRFEQHFVTAHAPNLRFWPKGWVRHFRRECVPAFPVNLVRPPRPPEGTRVVIFAGHLNPPEAIAGTWNVGAPRRSPAEHLRYALLERRSLAELPRYIHPAPWVAEAWRE